MENQNFAERSVPVRISTRAVRSAKDMMEILADDVLRYELLSEQEQDALEEALQGEAVEFAIEVDKENAPYGSDRDEYYVPESAELKHRVIKVSSEDCEQFLRDNVNKNTKYKTKSDLKIFQDWAKEDGEMRNLEEISAQELDSLLARMYRVSLILD